MGADPGARPRRLSILASQAPLAIGAPLGQIARAAPVERMEPSPPAQPPPLPPGPGPPLPTAPPGGAAGPQPGAAGWPPIADLLIREAHAWSALLGLHGGVVHAARRLAASAGAAADDAEMAVTSTAEGAHATEVREQAYCAAR